MPKEIQKYDAVVLGSGQGGNPLVQKLAERGERVALVESDQLGGTCINTGCTPTKAMVASAPGSALCAKCSPLGRSGRQRRCRSSSDSPTEK